MVSSKTGRATNSVKLHEKIMHSEFTAVFQRDGEWYIGYCAEVSGANGQGRTLDECRASLREAVALVLADRREDGLRVT
ncbi:MAG TPA: type II toxin-antitoxin system HicB family antitoxin [Pirellulales bacterium]|nr:type II toxin-antitoxin system HicB family antitoxin [Pirellulales bacterium]